MTVDSGLVGSKKKCVVEHKLIWMCLEKLRLDPRLKAYKRTRE